MGVRHCALKRGEGGREREREIQKRKKDKEDGERVTEREKSEGERAEIVVKNIFDYAGNKTCSIRMRFTYHPRKSGFPYAIHSSTVRGLVLAIMVGVSIVAALTYAMIIHKLTVPPTGVI
ncbi:Hypothetical predicted protein [Octopus vulgaris]|uniref:Uncharacterized protein n=1 Tax=Octopus vulgaris TaxID=6645 RepID=A0AA36FGS1_OCTVU|nr:Hypothetical predicted protein [Octopus vulgaris]